MELKDATLTQLKEERPELFKEIEDTTSKAVTEAMEVKFAEKEAEMEKEKTSLSAQLDKVQTITAELQKDSVIRNEKSMKKEADYAFSDALKDSNLGERLYPKVKAMVNHEEFIADGQMDMDKFKEAVLAEIKSWEDSGITDSSSVQGFSPAGKEVDENEFSNNETEDLVDKMLSSTSHVATKE
jgi:hypothetical protein